MSANNPIQIRASNIDNMENAAREDAAFEKILKFKKGQYYIQKEVIPIGSEFLAYASAWVKCWIKFEGGQRVSHQMYRVAYGEKPPEREHLGDLDRSNWPLLNGERADPWVYQYQVPFENLTSGEMVIFTTPSAGGRTAVADLCGAYVKRAKKLQNCGQPIIRLAKTEMITKKHGEVLRPAFQIVRWDDAESVELPPNPPEDPANFNDEIPF